MLLILTISTILVTYTGMVHSIAAHVVSVVAVLNLLVSTLEVLLLRYSFLDLFPIGFNTPADDIVTIGVILLGKSWRMHLLLFLHAIHIDLG